MGTSGGPWLYQLQPLKHRQQSSAGNASRARQFHYYAPSAPASIFCVKAGGSCLVRGPLGGRGSGRVSSILGSEIAVQLPAVCRGHCKPAKPCGSTGGFRIKEGAGEAPRSLSIPCLHWKRLFQRRHLILLVYCRGIVPNLSQCSKNSMVLARILRLPILIIFKRGDKR